MERLSWRHDTDITKVYAEDWVSTGKLARISPPLFGYKMGTGTSMKPDQIGLPSEPPVTLEIAMALFPAAIRSSGVTSRSASRQVNGNGQLFRPDAILGGFEQPRGWFARAAVRSKLTVTTERSYPTR
jgi:hypothetical protein